MEKNKETQQKDWAINSRQSDEQIQMSIDQVNKSSDPKDLVDWLKEAEQLKA